MTLPLLPVEAPGTVDGPTHGPTPGALKPAMASRTARPGKPPLKQLAPLTGWPLVRDNAVREAGLTRRHVAEKMERTLGRSVSHTLIYLLIRGLHGKRRPDLKHAFAKAVGRDLADLGWGPNGEDLKKPRRVMPDEVAPPSTSTPSTSAPSTSKGSLRLDSQVVGNVGMYYVCYRLSRLGWNVMPTSRNARGVDIVIYSGDARRKYTVQVKALSKVAPVPLGKGLDHLFADFFIVCSPVALKQPTCFVLFPDEVRTLAHKGEKEGRISYWLQPVAYDTDLFRENWDRIGQGTAVTPDSGNPPSAGIR